MPVSPVGAAERLTVPESGVVVVGDVGVVVVGGVGSLFWAIYLGWG